MKKLSGYGLYNGKGNHHVVKAVFRHEIEIVFEGMNRTECMKWCHENGMKMMDETKYRDIMNASFRKVNAKHPFDENEYRIAIVG